MKRTDTKRERTVTGSGLGCHAVWFSRRRGAEVAAVFADRNDANAYAQWWNREEVRRFGGESAVFARAEEIDFYQSRAWRPPPMPLRVVGDQTPH